MPEIVEHVRLEVDRSEVDGALVEVRSAAVEFALRHVDAAMALVRAGNPASEHLSAAHAALKRAAGELSATE